MRFLCSSYKRRKQPVAVALVWFWFLEPKPQPWWSVNFYVIKEKTPALTPGFRLYVLHARWTLVHHARQLRRGTDGSFGDPDHVFLTTPLSIRGHVQALMMENQQLICAFLHLAVFEGYWVSAKIIMSETLRFNTAAIFSIVSTLGTHLPDSIKYNWLLEIPVCATSLSCE